MTPQDRNLSLVACQCRASPIGPADDPPAEFGGASGQRGAWIDRFSTRAICFPDYDEAATTRGLRCTLVLFHRFAEHLVTLAEGSPRGDLPTDLVLAGREICQLLDGSGTIAAAIVTRILASLEPRLDEVIVDPASGRSAVLASPWLVFGLLDGFKAVAADMLRAVTQKDRHARCTPAVLKQDRMNQRVAHQFADRITTLYRAFAAAASIPLPADPVRDPRPLPDTIAPDITALQGGADSAA